VAVIATCWLAGCAQPAREASLTPEQQALNVASFDKAWEIIRDTHWDPALDGVDWDAARTDLRPKVEAATTMAQSRDAMEEMIKRLGKTHFGIIPGDVLEDIAKKDDKKPAADDAPAAKDAASETSKEGDPGLVLRVIDKDVVVTNVRPDTPAAEAGVKPGWIVRRIAGVELAPVVARMVKNLPERTYNDIVINRAMQGRLDGDIGTTVAVEFLDGADAPQQLSLARVAPRGKEVRFGNLPPMRVWWETRTLDGGIGYFALGSFFDPPGVDEAFAAALAAHRTAPGFIVDLRGNPGGIGLMAMGMAGRFYAGGEHFLGTMKLRQAALKFVVNPRRDAYTGPVAILVDGMSASTSEVLAGGLKDLGRARIFGTPTAGAALPAQVDKLPNGDALMHAVANYISAAGEELEGKGVQPDEVVAPTRAALLQGQDPALDAAVAWIQSRQGTMQPMAMACSSLR
jgi:carboxyl-terminal processing protease